MNFFHVWHFTLKNPFVIIGRFLISLIDANYSSFFQSVYFRYPVHSPVDEGDRPLYHYYEIEVNK